jgi:uncharacterized damage-inducible protein DinB
MKNIFKILFILVSLQMTAQEQVKNAFLEKWNNSKDYLLEVARAMPEENYDFKPTEREMTFGKQLLHIKANIDWLSSTYFSDAPKKEKETEAKLTKAQIIAELEKSFSQAYQLISKTSATTLNDKVDFFAGPKTKFQILNLLQDHVTHHRGQILVYLNLNGVKPPKYIGW